MIPRATRRVGGWALCALALGCGCVGGVAGPKVDGVVRVLNGPTQEVESGRRRADGDPLQDGTYALSPARMTLTITGVGLISEGGDENGVGLAPVDGCTATYDRSLSSLAQLEACDVALPVGTFDGLVLEFSTEFEMVVDDDVAGIWSDPDAPGGLTTTPPAGGARPIAVTDQNADGGDAQTGLFFVTPRVVAEGDVPEVFVVFDPTHWFKADFGGGMFSAPRAMGNPPLLPAVDGFAKATWYTNLPTGMSYNWGACDFTTCMSLLFLYRDDATPVTVTWQDHDICPSAQGMNPVVAFDGDGTRFGTYGMLGLDEAGTLAWASAWHPEGSPEIGGYTGVYRMAEAEIPGDVVSLDYQCTSDVPAPVAGENYGSGAPEFVPDGSLSMTRLY